MTSPVYHNRHKRRPHSKSGYRGVIFHRQNRYRPWKAYIRFQGWYRTIGYFRTKEEAAAAYNAHALKFFGPDSYFNPV